MIIWVVCLTFTRGQLKLQFCCRCNLTHSCPHIQICGNWTIQLFSQAKFHVICHYIFGHNKVYSLKLLPKSHQHSLWMCLWWLVTNLTQRSMVLLLAKVLVALATLISFIGSKAKKYVAIKSPTSMITFNTQTSMVPRQSLVWPRVSKIEVIILVMRLNEFFNSWLTPKTSLKLFII